MRKLTKYSPDVARVLLGLIFTVFGFNGFLGLFSMPPMPDAAGQFLGALSASGYFMEFLKTVESVGGLMLLFNVAAPFALVVLAPVMLNILLFHLFLAPGGTGLPVLFTALALFLGYSYRDRYRPLFATGAEPAQRQRFEWRARSPRRTAPSAG